GNSRLEYRSIKVRTKVLTFFVLGAFVKRTYKKVMKQKIKTRSGFDLYSQNDTSGLTESNSRLEHTKNP
ncbi:hypothetical protein, partial [Zhouia amylolytica]|uniref:hypothetical protein n=1 Tax=Zhouia amylolytica TaxID=376730 RepID=UPI001C31200F